MSKVLRRYLDFVGDVNPIDHGGGFVVKCWERYEHTQIELVEWDSDESEEGRLYRVSVPDDVFHEHNDDPAVLAKSIGLEDLDDDGRSPADQLRAMSAGSLTERVLLMEIIAGHWGWGVLDEYPLEVTRKSLARRWRRALKHRFPRKSSIMQALLPN